MYLQNKKSCSCLRKQEQVEHQKFYFSLRHHFHVWVTGYASHSESSTQGSMVSYSTGLVYPLWLASRGWSSPAILPPQDWTENLTINSPTLQPLNQVADGISCQNVSIYCPWWPRTSKKFKNSKFKILHRSGIEPWSPRSLTRITDALTTRPLVDTQEHQK